MTFVTVTLNSSDTLAPAVSVTVTLSGSIPTLSLVGVPIKVIVAGSNVSQEGSAVPSDNVALYVRVSPKSMSAKVLPGTVKLNIASSIVV